MDNEKIKSLQSTIERLEKQYGKGIVMKMDDTRVEGIEALSTGSLGLDIALGIGGFPKGRVIEIYGPESSGKTTLSMHAIAEASLAVSIPQTSRSCLQPSGKAAAAGPW